MMEKTMLLRSSLALIFALNAPGVMARPASGPYAELDFQLISVKVVDGRTDGPFFLYDGGTGRSYVAGINGRPYKIQVRNRSSAPVLIVPSVDGVNVLTGKTAAPLQSGYIVPAHGRVVVDGWRKSAQEVAEFFFTPQDNSYAARTGRPRDVGVIGLAVFRQAAPPSNVAVAPRQDVAGSASESPRADGRAQEYDSAARSAAPAAPSLGTGHGSRQRSEVTFQDFQRESSSPFEVAVLEYDSLENLNSRGVIVVAPVVRPPNPFPAREFVPDPPAR